MPDVFAFVNTFPRHFLNLCQMGGVQRRWAVFLGCCPSNYNVVLHVIGGFWVIYLIDLYFGVFLRSLAIWITCDLTWLRKQVIVICILVFILKARPHKTIFRDNKHVMRPLKCIYLQPQSSTAQMEYFKPCQWMHVCVFLCTLLCNPHFSLFLSSMVS